MPYVPEEDRLTGELSPNNKGELNLALTQVMLRYLDRKGLSYSHVNDCLGALDAAGREFYRRLAAPYEDKAIERNGDLDLYKKLTEGL